MVRSLSALVLSAAWLSCISQPVFGQFAGAPPAPQQTYYPLTLQSLPQMLQQAGFQVQPLSDNAGPYWQIIDPQSGKSAIVEPQQMLGNQIQSISIGVTMPLPPGGLQAQSFANVKAQMAPCVLSYNLPGNQLVLRLYHNLPDSNPQELRALFQQLVGKMNQANALLAGGGIQQPGFNQGVGQLSSLAIGTWTGTENLQGFGKITFQLMPNGKAIMVDAQNTVPGSWVANGNQVTINLGKYATYQGTILGNTFSGQGISATSTWAFNTTKSTPGPSNPFASQPPPYSQPPSPQQCLGCFGKGTAYCNHCKGTGKLQGFGNPYQGVPVPTCPICQGTGEKKCTSCQGKGMTK
jgi:hypothetical protein